MERRLIELARRAERPADPGEGLQALAVLRRELESLEAEHVEQAVRTGWSWREIAESLGVSKQAAHKKHAARIRDRAAIAPAVSTGVRRSVALARAEAKALGRSKICPEHLLLGVLRANREIAETLSSFGVSLDAARAAAAELAGPGEYDVSEGLEITTETRTAVERGVRIARRLGSSEFEVVHLLLGLLMDGRGGPIRVLEQLGCSPAEVETKLGDLVSSRPVPKTVL